MRELGLIGTNLLYTLLLKRLQHCLEYLASVIDLGKFLPGLVDIHVITQDGQHGKGVHIVATSGDLLLNDL